MRPVRHLLLAAYFHAVVALLFLPLCVVALMSFKDAAVIGFPIGRLTLGWYRALLVDREMLDALRFSLAVALLSSAVALGLGTWTALAIDALPAGPARLLLAGGAIVPLVTPGLIAAIALRLFLHVLGIEPGLESVTFGHAVQSTPIVTLVVGLRLRLMPRDLLEAASDLGATERQAFVFVTLPYLRPALLGSFVLALLLSFDEFVRAFFLGGYRVTLPVLIYGRFSNGVTPEITAAATLLLVLTIACGFVGESRARRIGRHGA